MNEGTLCSGTLLCSIAFVDATCPAGTHPIAGGFTLISGSGVVWASRMPPTGWTAAGDNYGGLDTATLRTYVYCSAGVTNVTLP